MAKTATQQLLTPDDVATILGVNVRAVYRLTESRKLASFNWGRRVRIAPDDLAKFLEAYYNKAEDLEALAETHCVGC
jgi:excisionase family DNA binding protein